MTAWASYPYQDRVVLVTGGGTGIGRAIVRSFLEQGASVAAVGRTRAALDEAVADFPAERVHVIVADLAESAAPADAVAETVARFGRLDVVVASAGTSEGSDIHDLDIAVWERQRAINLDSVIALAAASVPHLTQTAGNLLAISSIAGLRGDWGMFAYNATKAAVNVMMQALALDLGAVGVRVNALAPGFTASRLTQERLDDPEFRERLLDRVAIGRVADPEDIAKVALFLCSPDAGYMTGAIVPVDGGVSASSGTPRS
ncbi:SDR family NAD(P)-dependent oxidoreductase [Microbacterium atlanticum]|uniref:SDR family NAD(P)-dependent oxidoreductase n=1 Tax=Microbacterium atlanticum TaxID=2782168 RepID=UPI001887D3EC|nr:SDR family oxidoreductase [Microbacterium atlanticum]